MKLQLLTAVGWLLVIAGCTKNDTATGNRSNGAASLTDFSVKVLERTSITAIIQWDSSINKANNEPVKYKVILENQVLDTGLTRTIDTLFNLEKNRIYSGKVVAYITGDSVFSDFSLSTYEGFIYATTRTDSYGSSSRVGFFNADPLPGLSIQPSYWRYSAGAVFEPTLSNDTLFFVSNNQLKAVSASTGNAIWQAAVSIVFNTPVTYDKGKLYGCTSAGALVCINGSNGQLLWSYRSSLSYINFVTRPVVSGNKVFVTTKSSSGEIDCVDAQSGTKLWSVVNNYSTCNRPLAMDGVVVFIIGQQGRVLALDQGTGSVKWDRKDFGSTGLDQFDPVYLDGKVIVHTNGRLSALDLQTGREEWNYDRSGSFLSPVAGNGRVYVCQDSIAGYDQNPYYRNLLCLDGKDGHLVWEQSSKAQGHKYYRLVFAKDKIYCTEEYSFNPSFNRRIVAFNATNGNRDSFIDKYNPVSLSSYEHVYDFCVERDGIVHYPSTHGNYQ
jgi:outer membrane protein assembly factor BamB